MYEDQRTHCVAKVQSWTQLIDFALVVPQPSHAIFYFYFYFISVKYCTQQNLNAALLGKIINMPMGTCTPGRFSGLRPLPCSGHRTRIQRWEMSLISLAWSAGQAPAHPHSSVAPCVCINLWWTHRCVSRWNINSRRSLVSVYKALIFQGLWHSAKKY